MNVGMYEGNSTDVVIDGLCFESDGQPINDAEVVVSVYEASTDNNGEVVRGDVVPGLDSVQANYVGGTQGNYRARLPAAAIPPYNSQVLVVVTCLSHSASWSLPGRVRLRG